MRGDTTQIDFAGIGAEKCATTWLYRCLQEHPELHLLPKDNPKGAGFLSRQHSEEEREAYRGFYAQAAKEQLVGEFQVKYLRDAGVAARLHDHNPSMKLLVVLRNPVERAYSAYVHHYTLSKQETEWIPFREALDRLPQRLVGPGFYARYLQPYLARFPREQIHIVVQDDIKANPDGVVRGAYRFLGVDDSFVPENASQRVASGAFKTTGLGRFIHRRLTPLFKRSMLGWRFNESTVVGQ